MKAPIKNYQLLHPIIKLTAKVKLFLLKGKHYIEDEEGTTLVRQFLAAIAAL